MVGKEGPVRQPQDATDHSDSKRISIGQCSTGQLRQILEESATCAHTT